MAIKLVTANTLIFKRVKSMINSVTVLEFLCFNLALMLANEKGFELLEAFNVKLSVK